METPLLSVCLITYNHVKYIRQAIESVLMQQVDFNWEFIIADDCSTDGTTEIIEEYYANYPDLIKPILQKANVGPGNNFIELLSAAMGRYVAYLEGDDYWTDEKKLWKQVSFLENNPDFSVVCHRAQSFHHQSGDFHLLPKEGKSESTLKDILEYNFILSLTVVFRNYYLKRYIPHFWNKMSDYSLHLSNAQFGKIKYLDDVMAVYRLHSQSTWSTQSFEKRIYSIIEDYKEIDKDFSYNYHNIISKAICLRRNELCYINLVKEKKLTIYNIIGALKYRFHIAMKFFK